MSSVSKIKLPNNTVVDIADKISGYGKFVHLTDESDMPASPDPDTLYLIDDDGSAGGSYTLPIASASTLGGIKVGSGLSINSSTGVLSATGGGSGGGSNSVVYTTSDSPSLTDLWDYIESGTPVYLAVEPDQAIKACFILTRVIINSQETDGAVFTRIAGDVEDIEGYGIESIFYYGSGIWDSAAYVAALPLVSSTDSGKILKVSSNGRWTASSDYVPKSGGTMNDNASLEFYDDDGIYSANINHQFIRLYDYDDGFGVEIDSSMPGMCALEGGFDKSRNYSLYTCGEIINAVYNGSVQNQYIIDLPTATGTLALTSDIPTVPTISTSITTDASSDTKTASPKAVKTYVDNMCGNIETLLASLL